MLFIAGKLTAIPLIFLRQINVENHRPLNSQARIFINPFGLSAEGKYRPKGMKSVINRLLMNIGVRLNMEKRATLIGLAAIVLWSTMVGLIRGVSEGLGPVGGAAMIYTLSGLLCWLPSVSPNAPDPARLSAGRQLLFVSYEICLALSLGFAGSRQQAIEVGMVNYPGPA
jgi:hypothetical protein